MAAEHTVREHKMTSEEGGISNTVETEQSDLGSLVRFDVAFEVANGHLTTSEKVKIHCSPGTCHVRWVRCKGAILVLVWNCLIVTYVNTLLLLVPGILGKQASAPVTTVISRIILAASWILLYPFAGWLADVYYGRYQVIHASLWLMWGGMVATVVCFCIKVGVREPYSLPITDVIFFTALIVALCGIAGFRANVVPYGTDQLVESSGSELSAYIHWFTFSFMFVPLVARFPYHCIINNPEYAYLTLAFVSTIMLSLALCLNFHLKHWLIIEGTTRNPVKTVYQVLNYARKYKTARFRSAFTYHIEGIPSRIEMAKPQYGGPYSTEQVEDVKTFLQIVYVLLPVAAVIVIGGDGLNSTFLFSNHFITIGGCVTGSVISSTLPFLLVIVCIPVYEFIVHPLIHNFVPSILKRVGIGFVLYVLGIVALLVIDVVSRARLVTLANDTCLFSEVPATSLMSVSQASLTVPGLISAFGLLINLTAQYEFIIAQSPHGMKGLLIGLLYGIEGIYYLFVTIIQLPFRFGFIHTSKSHVFPSCTSIYFLIIISLSLAILVWFTYVARKYKKRERNPTTSPHFFVEQAYNKYLS